MTFFVPVHGFRGVEIGGRWYEHIPSPVRKRGADDTSLLFVHPGQSGPHSCKTRFRVVVAGRRWGVEFAGAATDAVRKVVTNCSGLLEEQAKCGYNVVGTVKAGSAMGIELVDPVLEPRLPE